MATLTLRYKWLLMLLTIFILTSISARAAEDTFYVTVGDNNNVESGGGTGYNGTWYFYPNTNWLNQWFYNGPYNPNKKKVIDLSMTIKLRPGAQRGFVQIAYNWSTPEWSNKGQDHPPLPEDVPDESTENEYIRRNKFFKGTLRNYIFFRGGSATSSGIINIKNHYEITDYNPEWISIDIKGYNFVITDGCIKHECVPKDSTQPLPGQIHGIKWKDLNGNGYQDFLEPGLANWKIYLDNNPNGQWDSDEPYQITDIGGHYRFTNLSAGSYTVAEVLQSGWEQTFPAGGTHTVTVGAGEIITNINFGNRQPPAEEMDFGDAPRPYPTLLTNDGARHKIVPSGPWLGDAGDSPDPEADGQPDFWAFGDDSRDGNNDERGVSGLQLSRGKSVTISVYVSGGGGYVDAWIDFNKNGNWNDPDEQVHSGWLPDGDNPISVTTPSNSTIGLTYSRFRISSLGGLAPTGPADDGEVEDHSVWISPW